MSEEPVEFECTDCGATVSADAKVCPKCGVNLEEPSGFKFLFPKVAFKDRLLAYLWDLLVLVLFNFLIGLGLRLMFVFGEWTPFIVRLIGTALFLLRDGFNGGTGFGKSQRNIIVIDVDTRRECSYWKSVVRNFLILLFFPIGILTPGIETGIVVFYTMALFCVLVYDISRMVEAEGGRRIGDLLAHTQVVYFDDSVQFAIEKEKYEKTQGVQQVNQQHTPVPLRALAKKSSAQHIHAQTTQTIKK
jgi:hypothetical protein